MKTSAALFVALAICAFRPGCGIDLINPTRCRRTGPGHEYMGPVRTTASGRTCQAWSSSDPHVPNPTFVIDENFPDGSVAAAENFCRNPEPGFTSGVWCYTTDPGKRWDLCYIPRCPVCRSTQEGHNYMGFVSTTTGGRTCQPWSESEPHVPNADFVIDENFPDGSVAAAENFCRNPEPAFTSGVWCYTLDPDKRWELCDVPRCSGCLETAEGYEYMGAARTTASGIDCQAWSATEPHVPNADFVIDQNFPDGSRRAANNFCRNPEPGFTKGVWCYTTDSNTRWEICDVPVCDDPECDCRPNQAGHDYMGRQFVTATGRQCQAWSASEPHVPNCNFVIDENFPDGSVAAANNFCRNPKPCFSEGVWCYTTDPDKRWELCDVPLCLAV